MKTDFPTSVAPPCRTLDDRIHARCAEVERELSPATRSLRRERARDQEQKIVKREYSLEYFGRINAPALARFSGSYEPVDGLRARFHVKNPRPVLGLPSLFYRGA